MHVVLIFLSKYWKQVLMFLAGAFILWRVWKSFSNGNPGSINVKYEVRAPSISVEMSKALAATLYNAMESVGTDLDEVNSVYLKICKNADDVKLVFNAFGNPGYGFFGSSLWGQGTPTNLRGWINNELAGDDKKKWLTLFDLAGVG